MEVKDEKSLKQSSLSYQKPIGRDLRARDHRTIREVAGEKDVEVRVTSNRLLFGGTASESVRMAVGDGRKLGKDQNLLYQM